MAKLSPVLNDAQFSNTDAFLVGGKIYTYAAGSSTPQTTYTSSSSISAQTNPIILNARGEVDNPIWLTEGLLYKLRLFDASNNFIREFDNVAGVGDTSITIDQWIASGLTPTYINATQFTLAGDQTSTFMVNRRLKFTVTAGTVYGYITASVFGALTTVTVALDSGVLDSGLSAVSYGLITPTQTSLPVVQNYTTAYGLNNSAMGASMVNGTLIASVAASALTVAIKTLAGADPSATDPVKIYFRNATAATGDYTVLTLTAATSLVVSSGSTLGTTNAVPHRLWILGFNDAATFRLGIINTQITGGIFPLGDEIISSSTAEGGAGAADSAGVIYTGTAVTAKGMRILGYVESTQATAGTWATTPSFVQLFAAGVHKPGDTVQTVISIDGAVNSGSTTVPSDDTIPQNTEGNQFMTQAITPTSAINRLHISHFGNYANGTGSVQHVSALFQDATANALAAFSQGSITANVPFSLGFQYEMRAATTSSTTFKIRTGPVSASTITFNGAAAARLYGGTYASTLKIIEVMA